MPYEISEGRTAHLPPAAPATSAPVDHASPQPPATGGRPACLPTVDHAGQAGSAPEANAQPAAAEVVADESRGDTRRSPLTNSSYGSRIPVSPPASTLSPAAAAELVAGSRTEASTRCRTPARALRRLDGWLVYLLSCSAKPQLVTGAPHDPDVLQVLVAQGGGGLTWTDPNLLAAGWTARPWTGDDPRCAAGEPRGRTMRARRAMLSPMPLAAERGRP